MSFTFFQSSPPPKERCNLIGRIYDLEKRGVFQSSPPPKERCNPPSASRSLSGMYSFNPHRPRRSGAIPLIYPFDGVTLDFQSSPPPKERCNSTLYNSLFLPDLQGGFRRPLRTES